MKVHALLLLLGAALVAATSEPEVDLPPPPDEESCIGSPEDGRWRKECNWCSCRNGKATCTRKLCPQGLVDDGPQCEGNPTWKDDCNTCQCADGRAVCTEKFCGVPGPPAPQVTQTVTVQRPGGHECEDGSRWRNGCNWCTCEDGRSHCAESACEDWDEDEAREEGIIECHGTSRWKKDCNWCNCVNGLGVCTQRACIPPERDPFHGLPEDAMCVPGSRWKDECNWCGCTDDGGAFCTLMGCFPGFKDEGPTCEDGSVWKSDDCNICRCVDGVSACTKRLCPEENPFHGLPEGAVCAPGSRWKKECNWCSCTENGASLCTLKGCLPGYRDDGPTCEDGSVWKNDDCNICRCIDGVSACTKRLCPEREEDPFHGLPETAVCVPGSRWKKECNWCNCAENGMAGCTLIGCLPGYEDDGPTCEDGSVWKNDDCNICRCIDGVSACTKKLCRPQQPASTSPQVIAVPEEPECQGEPGTDRWREDCNWCSCRNGVGACTRRLCREGVRDERPECEGNPSWMKDCNRCHCVNGRAVCTTKFCGPLPPRHGPHRTAARPECQGEEEDDFWTKDCNRCRCRNGVPSCTKRLCRSNEDSTPVCGGNPSWKKDCNYCRCNNGTVLCTTKFCSPPVRPPIRIGSRRVQLTRVATNDNPECEPGSRWRVGCNWCSCRGGRGVCTIKACQDQSAQSDEPECEGDSTWKQDCNWCTCGDGMALCTRMACHEPSEKPCIEGRSWKKDCNICRCSQGFVLCTKKACPKPGRELGCQGDSCQTTQPRPPSQLPELCNLPAVSGPLQCTAFFQKWSFSAAIGACQQIVYGGCGGTDNLFDNQAECETACPSSALTQTRRTSVGGRKAPIGQDRCHLPKESGPCFALFTHYAYNAANGLCEEFTYGGCEGNANNFKTQEECLAACQGSQEVGTCDRSKCPWPLWEHYLAKDCAPVYAGDACCPTSFQCPSASESGKNQSQCHYRGVSYNVGDSVPIEEPCSASCHCSEPYIPGGPSEVHCANVECPDLFRPPTPGCRPLYRAGQCCAYDHECVDADAPPLEPRSASCTWLNQTYQAGSKMYFDDYPCQACICGPDFTDPTGPGCYKVDCGFDFRYTSEYHRGCTPIHFELDSCCPIEFLCPDDAKIKPQEQQQQQPGTADESAMCHLGERRLAVGEVLGLTDCKIECRCMTPPELTCIQFRSCELAEETAAKRACPPLECGSGCHPVLGGPEECPTCSCSPDTFSCPAQTCPRNCQPELDLQTGCPSCKCKCPEVMCPAGCPSHTVLDEATGCPRCVCQPGTARVLNPEDCPVYPSGEVPCPQDCAIIRRADENGCEVCECDPDNTDTPFGRPLPPGLNVQNTACRTLPDGRAPCPMDCAIRRRTDENGCEVCECDPDNTDTPFGRPPPPNPNLQDSTCRTMPDGRAPCPMDCAIRRRTDENGCEVCECDPDKTVSPFGRPPPPNPNLRDSTCRTMPDGRAPCPMDCAIRRRTDENGCEVCECDPDITISPFGPPPPPNPNLQGTACLTMPDGRAPCPMDCAIIRRTDENGCEVCECDPDNPGNPFGPPPPPPPPDSQHRYRRSWSCPEHGEAPCPTDCGIKRTIDENGCEVCVCDPDATGYPFGPFGPPPPPPTQRRVLRSWSCPGEWEAPCPQDCAVVRNQDANGCWTCTCDPTNPGNPFGPFGRPLRPYW